MSHMAKEQAIHLLENSLAEIPKLKTESTTSQPFIIWRRNTRVALQHVFGKESDQVGEFEEVNFVPPVMGVRVVGVDYSETDRRRSKDAFEFGLLRAEAILKSMITDITYWVNDSQDNNPENKPDVVFVAHGSNNEVRLETEKLLTQLELDHIVLQDQPHMGRTLIDKFEEESNKSGFAVIILTPDDEGRRLGSDGPLVPRARQNAILELGYLASSLGRNRICLMYDEEVELPSDIRGIAYIKIGKNDWKFELVRELNTAGFDADANRIVGNPD